MQEGLSPVNFFGKSSFLAAFDSWRCGKNRVGFLCKFRDSQCVLLGQWCSYHGAVTITGATWPLESLVAVGEGALSLFLKARKNGDGVVLWRWCDTYWFHIPQCAKLLWPLFNPPRASKCPSGLLVCSGGSWPWWSDQFQQEWRQRGL
jgi:hypothetical protein